LSHLLLLRQLLAFIGNVGRNIQHTLETMDTVLGEEDACRWAERNTDAFAIVNWWAGVGSWGVDGAAVFCCCPLGQVVG